MPQEESRRTSPDVFLRLLEKSRRGKLKIYIGHAAGVGKTYQMLEDAHALKKQGVDVVAGIIETHGRAETAEKIGDLEVIPRRKVSYKGKELEEMDLLAILARKPEVVLVDELAHTNVPGTKNEKRYQDVEDILAAGICRHDDRQHSALRVRPGDRLACDRRRRSRARSGPAPAPGRRRRQRGSPLGGADRASAGGKDLPRRADSDGASRTSSPRKTSLRFGSSRCARSPTGSKPNAGEPMEAPRLGPVGAKAMVAISSNPETTRLLLRRASAIAGRLNTNWFAVYVRTKRDSPQRMDAREHRLLSENVTLAMELGAKVVWLSGDDVAQELLRFAHEQGVTLAIFGKSRRPGPVRLFRKSPIDRFASVGTGIDVYEIETRAP